jgi:hypothetical protein
MGLNTVIMINNDYLCDLDDSRAHWALELLIAIRGMKTGGVRTFPWTKLVSMSHSDSTQVVAVGGNTGELLHVTGKRDKLDLIREMAEEAGYTLVKKDKA